MTRRPLKLLRHLSLLLCLAAAALWSLSGLQAQHLVFSAGGRLWVVRCGEGTVAASTVRPWPVPERWRWVRGRPDHARDRMPLLHSWGRGPRRWERWGLSGLYGPVATPLDGRGRPVAATGVPSKDFPRSRPLNHSAPMSFRAVEVPMWVPVAATAAYPLASFALAAARAGSRRRRRAAGRCARCGYDLRGNPTGVCPECGVAVTEAK